MKDVSTVVNREVYMLSYVEGREEKEIEKVMESQ